MEERSAAWRARVSVDPAVCDGQASVLTLARAARATDRSSRAS
jgi:hypothetical protein